MLCVGDEVYVGGKKRSLDDLMTRRVGLPSVTSLARFANVRVESDSEVSSASGATCAKRKAFALSPAAQMLHHGLTEAQK